ncbi:Zinc finger protein 347 [Eumeta japonica]|uniref:Zinc finger protein 347 n=1 Tax=Eumeta variegata TaxID=151549 RepID=A0A4C1S8I1_EUMVA|nr:Zinc finger protein 347 [Eumeta japonica]
MVKKLEFHYRGEHLGKKPGLCNVCGNTFTDYKHWKKHVGAHAGTKHRCEYCMCTNRNNDYCSCATRESSSRGLPERYLPSTPFQRTAFIFRATSSASTATTRRRSASTAVKLSRTKSLCARQDKIRRREEFSSVKCARRSSKRKSIWNRTCSGTGLKPYVCSTCGNAYKSKCSLKSHIRSHTGERPFKCDVCLSCFWSSSILNRHKRLHTGEKAYKCTLCDKGYNIKKMLLKHLECHEKSNEN